MRDSGRLALQETSTCSGVDLLSCVHGERRALLSLDTGLWRWGTLVGLYFGAEGGWLAGLPWAVTCLISSLVYLEA